MTRFRILSADLRLIKTIPEMVNIMHQKPISAADLFHLVCASSSVRMMSFCKIAVAFLDIVFGDQLRKPKYLKRLFYLHCDAIIGQTLTSLFPQKGQN